MLFCALYLVKAHVYEPRLDDMKRVHEWLKALKEPFVRTPQDKVFPELPGVLTTTDGMKLHRDIDLIGSSLDSFPF